jgi:hypothetical protein
VGQALSPANFFSVSAARDAPAEDWNPWASKPKELNQLLKPIADKSLTLFYLRSSAFIGG